MRRALGRLEDHCVARGQCSADQATGHGDRVVPGRHGGDHAPWVEHHEVRGVPAPLQGLPSVQRAELCVLAERTDAGLDATTRVGERLAHLPGRPRGQLVDLGSQAVRCAREQRSPLARRRTRPAAEGLARGADRAIDLGSAGNRQLAHEGAVGRIEHTQQFSHEPALSPDTNGKQPWSGCCQV